MRRSAALTGGLAAVLFTLGVVAAVFSSVTSGPASVFSAGDLAGWEPSAVTGTRTATTTCLVSWTPRSNPPAGLTYDVTDGTGATVATGVSGTSVSVTVPSGQTSPTVKARLNQWVSSTQAVASPACHGYPSAPTGVSVTPGDAQLLVSWTAPAGNGGTVMSYAVTGTPSDGSLPTATCPATVPAATCTLTGLTNGATYTVVVTATSNVGTGPASTGTTGIPYPATVMTAATMKLWLDGADSATLYAAASCSGGAATTSVGCWQDKSASANSATQAAGGNQPALATVTGRSVPSFDGSGSYLALTPGLLPNGTTASTIFAVATLTDPSPGTSGLRSVLNHGTLSGGAARQIQKLANASTRVVSVGTNTTQGNWSSSPGLVVGEYTASSISIGSDGRPAAAVTGLTNNTGTTYADVGSSGTPSQFWYGQIPEIIVFTGTLTSTDRRTVEEYLARKWAVPLTPQAPTAVTAIAGDTQATVSWAAPGWNGSTAVTAYTVTATPTAGTGYGSATTQTCSTAATTCTVTGLTNGLTYTVTATASNSVGTGPASASTSVIPFPALLVSSNAQLWLDGTDPDGDGVREGAAENCDTAVTCTAASNALTRWEDKSGRNHDALQATTAMSGTYVPAAGTVSFNANGYYQASSIGVSPDATAFVVASAAATTYNTNGWLLGGRSADGWMFHPQSAASSTRFFGITHAGYNNQTTLPPLVGPSTAITSAHLHDGWISGTATQTLNYSIDGAVGTTVSNSTARAAGTFTATIGADDLDLAGRRGNGAFRELAAFDRALTSSERRSVQEYLARKWAVPITAQAPTSVTATASTTANGTASVAWTTPAWDGGTAVSSYTLVATPADATLATLTQTGCTSSPCTLTGLTDGAAYAVTVAAVNSAGTGPASSTAGVTAVPAALLSASALWLDGADPAVLLASSSCTGAAASGSLGCWKDKSSNANHAGQAAGGSQPGLGTVNGRSSPSFDGTNSFLALAAPAALPTGTTSSTEFVVASLADTSPSSTGFRAVLDWGGTGSGAARSLFKVSNAATAQFDARFTSASTPGSWSTSGPSLLAAEAAGAGTTLRTGLNAAPWTSTTAVSFTTATTAGYIGQNVAAGSRWNGTVSEAIVFTGTMTATNRRTLEEYLARKWVVTITPQAPTITSTTGGNAQVAVSWNPPGWNGGAAVTGYTVTASPGGATCTTAAASCTVTGLTNGTAYTFTVTATNSAGAGPASTASGSVTPVTVPGAPTAAAAAAGDTTSSVSWSAPASNGGAVITSFTATGVPSDGSLPTVTCTAASSPCTLTALTDGVSYTVTVTATNAVGTGAPSSAVTVIPYPTALMATGTMVSWFDADRSGSLLAPGGGPASSGGKVATWVDSGAGGLNATQATSANQPTVASIGSRTAVLHSTSTYLSGNSATVQTVVSVASPNRSAPWSTIYASPASTDTSVRLVNGYLTPTPNVNDWQDTVTTNAWQNSVTSNLAGATTGAAVYTATHSAARTGTFSLGSGFSVFGVPRGMDGLIGEVITFNRPLTTTERRSVEEYLARKWAVAAITPQAPTGVTAAAGNAQASVSWSAPGWNGGAPVTGYTVTASPGGATCTSSATSCTVTGLTNGTAYTFTVAAANSVGGGPASAASNAVTPMTVAGAPTGVQAWVSDTTAYVAWSAPSSNGGSAITSYTASAVPASGPTLTCSAASGPCQLTGLVNATAYTVSVTATNAAGTGSPSGTAPITTRAAQGLYLWGQAASSATTPTQTGNTGTQWRQVTSGGALASTSCGIRTDWTLWCGGNNTYGQVGDGTTTNRATPVQVGSGTTWVSVSVGGYHTCAAKADGTAWCWGTQTTYGQLGDGTTTQRLSPVQVGSGATWATISTGERHTCGTRYDGTAWCWGYNLYGQLGQSSTDGTAHSSPLQVGSSTSWANLTTGSEHTCGTLTDGTLWCWGNNGNGRLGDGSASTRSSPVQIGSATTWTTASGGDTHTCGTRTDGTLWCWGANGSNQVGDATTTQRSSPVQVGSSTSWAGVTAGYNHSCGWRTTGTLWCWGANASGQLGDTTTTQRTSPVQVGSATGWTTADAGYFSSVGLL